MAPKNNAKGGDKKGKGKDEGSSDKGKGLKPASSINVRHILVCSVLSFLSFLSFLFGFVFLCKALRGSETSQLHLIDVWEWM